MNKLEFYQKQEFDLVKIQRYDKAKLNSNNEFAEFYDGKHPIEPGWVNQTHKDRNEWEQWIKQGFNIGVKTGKNSNITVIDVDIEQIPLEISNLIGDCILQKTNKGWHLFFKYEPELPKTRIGKLHIDIETDGGQVVISPSIIEGIQRNLYIQKNNKLHQIIEFKNIQIPIMPIELKEYLKSNITVHKLPEKIKTGTFNYENLKPEDFTLNAIPEGTRHTLFMHLGGILRKELNINQSTLVLNLLNRYLCKPPLSQSEFTNVIKSLDKYIVNDEIVLAQDILDYLTNVPNNDATKSEIELAVKGNFQKGEAKKRVDKALKYLVKEEYVIRKGRHYIVLHKAEWKDTFLKEIEELPFNVPYFHEKAVFRNGDLIVLGARSGTGKTHIAMNIIKQLVDQNIKPYYVSLECGSRFAIIGKTLGLHEKEYLWDDHYRAENIELEKGGITIVDWLLPGDYAATDKLYEHFARQLKKKGGLLIVFTQLKPDGSFYAEEMVRFFASLVAKFSYKQTEGEESGITSEFKTTKIREPRQKSQIQIIPCRYGWESKELKQILQNKEIPQKEQQKDIL